MQAYSCDRCKSLFTRNYVPDITVRHYHHGYGEDRKDLCPSCQAKLEAFLQNKPIDGSPSNPSTTPQHQNI